jgi:hypothetical protein
MTYLNCSRCGLSIPAPRVATLTPEYCPRCIATRRVASPLFASPLTVRELTDAEDGEAEPVGFSPHSCRLDAGRPGLDVPLHPTVTQAQVALAGSG